MHDFRFDGETLKVLAFVERTVSYGVPERVALTRAAKRFGLDKRYLKALRSLTESNRSTDIHGRACEEGAR